MTSDDRDPVDVLAEEFADRLRRGEHPSVSDYAVAHPLHAEQLRDLLPAVAQMEYLKRFRRAVSDTGKTELPDRFGDFRIVREVGRGGMGVVFEAVQESLGRPVALKVLATHAQLDATRRERFVREAQAAARLHHTNIVPVFGVGEQDGLPYFVMQLIRGDGLHTIVQRWRQQLGKQFRGAGSTEVIRKADTTPASSRSPEPVVSDVLVHEIQRDVANWAFIAETGRQAADALHYAHQQGVLHRDIKPANLLIDEANQVWVADFGLAKLVEQEGLTASGDILGTLQYLAPECLAGESDVRSDVYGLGATLYELITLEPPYAAETPARLLKQVTDHDPVPPRQINPDIPRDLETIVMKAMAREPRQRYSSANELARDLQAFLEDRPIQARRQSWTNRVIRWCRRNPSTAILTASTATALLLTAVVGWVGYVQTKQALNAEASRRVEAEHARSDADKARKATEQASERLEVNLSLSLETFEKVFDAIGGGRVGFPMRGWGRGGSGGPGGPGAPGGGAGLFPAMFGPGGPAGNGPGPPEAADMTAVLEAVLAFYDAFAKQNATNPRMQFEAGKAHRRVGEAQMWIDQEEKAIASFRRAATVLEQLVKQFPQDDSMKLELAQTYLLAPPQTFGPESEKPLVRAEELARAVGLDGPSRWVVGGVHWRLGVLREVAKNYPEAEAAYDVAIDTLTSGSLTDRPFQATAELASARAGLGRVLTQTKRLTEAKAVLQQSIQDLAPITKSGPPYSRMAREISGFTQYQLADVLERLGDRAVAERTRAAAEQMMKQGGPGGAGGFQFGGPGGGGGGSGGPKKGGPPRKN